MSDEDRSYTWLDTLPPEALALLVAWFDQAPEVFRKRCEAIADEFGNGNPQLVLWLAAVDRALFALGYSEAVLPMGLTVELFQLGASPMTIIRLIDDMVKAVQAEIRDEEG
ncbi:hypothetical protein LWC34_38925 [Kibdelosporangium philippinense]|uniref:Uncharacterized protein n=1 Tax=Kibdelosporangium philippinense TaxID=211113 RepID=A0ABS8ZLV5_9PSEU|nr:hypothetical protein [Kibdelosporangium philippinense]MCE7008744.1 hypothetical protein [Kibdelosporangium philippinense]